MTYESKPQGDDGPLPEAAPRDLLIVDDDQRFCDRLARAMERRGFTVEAAYTVADGLAVARRLAPRHAVVDLRLDAGPGPEGEVGRAQCRERVGQDVSNPVVAGPWKKRK